MAQIIITEAEYQEYLHLREGKTECYAFVRGGNDLIIFKGPKETVQLIDERIKQCDIQNKEYQRMASEDQGKLFFLKTRIENLNWFQKLFLWKIQQ